MRVLCTITLVLLFAMFISPADGKVNVVCSIPDFVPIVKEIGGNFVEVKSLMPPGCDPHAFTVSAKTMSELERADLIVLADSKLISFEEKIKNVFPDKCIDFDDYVKYGVKVEDFPHYSPCYHGYWLKLENGIAIAKTVEKALAKLDPENSRYFENNLKLFEMQVREAENVIKKQSIVKGKYCVAAVPGVCYIAENSGMKVGAVLMGESAGFTSGSEIMRLEKLLSSNSYACIIVPGFAKNSKVGELALQLSKDCGKPVVYVKFVMASNNDTYVGIAYYNAMALNFASEVKVTEKTPGFGTVIAVMAIVVLACTNRFRRY
ncbi:MAG: hypothetical protein DSY33_00570 [Archaeoglobus sp.]|nr:MAG: hypothetical protein DSY33_00570 [Archaeoglobus sp.]